MLVLPGKPKGRWDPLAFPKSLEMQEGRWKVSAQDADPTLPWGCTSVCGAWRRRFPHCGDGAESGDGTQVQFERSSNFSFKEHL